MAHLACSLCFPTIQDISGADVRFLVNLLMWYLLFLMSPALDIGYLRGFCHGHHHHPI